MTFLRRYRLRHLYADRDARQAAYDAACARGDTRAQSVTRKALQAATLACMKLEGRG